MRKLIVCLLVVTGLGCMPSADAARPGGGGSGASAPSYTAKNLGVLPGDVQSIGFGVSEAGSVVGGSVHFEYDSQLGYDVDVWNAFYWDGQMHKLTSAGSSGEAYAIAGSTRGSEYAVGMETTPGARTHAVIWIGAKPPTVRLDDDASTSSVAWGVNADGVAVGDWGSSAAIWKLTGTNSTGYSRTTFDFGAGKYTSARGINRTNIVVGYSVDPNDFSQTRRNAFIRLANGGVHGLPPAMTYLYADAFAVSDEFTTPSGTFVYVAGSTTKSDGTQSAARWTVNVLTGAVSELLVLAKEWSAGVNIDGEVACTGSSRGRQNATLFDSGVYLALKPPKGATDAATYGLAGTKSPTMYVVGVAQVSGLRAVLWEVK